MPLDVETRDTLRRACVGLGIELKYPASEWRAEEGLFISRIALARAMQIVAMLPQGERRRSLYRSCMRLKLAMESKEN